ncbi:hypothetical protein [Arthrobacter sp. ISL-28]|uniref:hypothetical protein n=1 Tax=Arthrobacter sp. ISL-28 TaxID=2819108 RepID=UPI001BE5C7B2|nr:hypothetical protein [Arthrobacter sp. ISL-28]MBT2519474.1 hypothetical protein [Arthrobacter sp. ISL-28]
MESAVLGSPAPTPPVRSPAGAEPVAAEPSGAELPGIKAGGEWRGERAELGFGPSPRAIGVGSDD